MGKFVIDIEIEAPIEKVFAFLSDPKSNEKVFPEEDKVKIEVLSKGPPGVGTKFRFTGLLAGQKIHSDAEYVEFEKNRRFVERQTEGDMKKWEQTFVFKATGKGTKVNLITEYQLPYSILGKIIDRLKAGKEIQTSVKASTEKAKEILEERKTR